MPARALRRAPSQEERTGGGPRCGRRHNAVHAAGTPRRAVPSGIALTASRSVEAALRSAHECLTGSLWGSGEPL